jgi:hypothetical protein
LKALAISVIAEWDVLVFIHRNGTSLATTEQIARVLGYNKALIGAALEVLTATTLVERTRGYEGVCLYRFLPLEDSLIQYSFNALLNMTARRGGRLLLIRAFQQLGKKPGELPGLKDVHLA